ncbi:beta-lactamase family protein [Mesorhizobium sp. M0700]|uniref:serine hydrolase domain-containing protein n=1 Tax=Mesorhizobium sp. M0700 TaxID=2956988 RepID=UPI00333C3B64
MIFDQIEISVLWQGKIWPRRNRTAARGHQDDEWTIHLDLRCDFHSCEHCVGFCARQNSNRHILKFTQQGTAAGVLHASMHDTGRNALRCRSQRQGDAVTGKSTQTLISDLVRADAAPGAAAYIIAPKFGVEAAVAAGITERAGREPLTIDRPVRISSVTKPFVAAAILRLWETGKIDLDQPIGSYLTPAHAMILTDGGYDARPCGRIDSGIGLRVLGAISM